MLLSEYTRRTTCKDREVKEVYKSSPAYSKTPPSSFALTQKLSLFVVFAHSYRCWNVLFAPDFFTSFRPRPQNLSCPTPHAFYFYSPLPNLYILSFFVLVSSNDNSRMLFSVFTVFPPEQCGRLAGDVLHIPWAQDLLLVSFCGCCEVQLVSYVSPVKQSTSNVAWNSLQSWCKLCEKKKNHFSASACRPYVSFILC